MKKFLLTLVGIICSLGMWADETVFSYTVESGTAVDAASVTATGGTVDFKVNAIEVKNNNPVGAKLAGDGQYIKCTLSDNATLKNGDKIELQISQNSSSSPSVDTYGVTVLSESGATADGVVYVSTSTGKGVETGSFKVGDDLNGKNVFYIYRKASSSMYLHSITITRSVNTEAYTVTFDAGSHGSCTTSDLTESAANEGVTLPSASANDGYEFLGWATSETATTADAGDAGDSYKPTSNCTLYAVYSCTYATSTLLYSAKVAATSAVSIDASTSKQTFTSDQATVVGGTIAANNGQEKAMDLISSQSSKYYFTMKNGNTFFTVTLADGKTIQAGDVITATMSAAERGLKFGIEDNWEESNPGDASSTTSFSYTVKADDAIVGQSSFNVFRATSNSTYFTDFAISRPQTVSSDIKINAIGYGTFSSQFNVMISGAKVYKATLNTTNNKIECTEITSGIVPAGTGVLLYKEGVTEATTATALYVDAADAITDNDLKATTLVDGSLAEKESSLALSHDSNTFKTFTGTAFVAGKAYFPYTSSGASKTFTIVFDGDETTAINSVESVASNNAPAYNLAGQRVNANAKGIVIKNGRKFINK